MSAEAEGFAQFVEWRGRAVTVPGAASTWVTAINDRGVRVGYYATTSGVFHGYIDPGGAVTMVNDPHAGTATGQGTTAQGISNTGVIVGTYSSIYVASPVLLWLMKRQEKNLKTS